MYQCMHNNNLNHPHDHAITPVLLSPSKKMFPPREHAFDDGSHWEPSSTPKLYPQRPSTMAVPTGNHRRPRSYSPTPFGDGRSRREPSSSSKYYPQAPHCTSHASAKSQSGPNTSARTRPKRSNPPTTKATHTLKHKACPIPHNPIPTNRIVGDWTKAAPYSLVTQARICEYLPVSRGREPFGVPLPWGRGI